MADTSRLGLARGTKNAFLWRIGTPLRSKGEQKSQKAVGFEQIGVGMEAACKTK
jgi:hypothetical protein